MAHTSLVTSLPQAINRSTSALALAVLSVFFVACDNPRNQTQDESSDYSEPADDFWSICPEGPIYDRALEWVDEPGFSSPAAAVQAVLSADTDIEAVEVAESNRTADVSVTRGKETGVFHLGKRKSGWLIKGGEGCAAWYAGEKVLGPPPDCETETICITGYVDD